MFVQVPESTSQTPKPDIDRLPAPHRKCGPMLRPSPAPHRCSALLPAPVARFLVASWSCRPPARLLQAGVPPHLPTRLHAQPTRLHAQSLKQIADAVKAQCSRLFYSQEEADAKQAHYQVSLLCVAAARRRRRRFAGRHGVCAPLSLIADFMLAALPEQQFVKK